MSHGLAWYQVLYRTKRIEVVQGEAQLQRVLARKVPQVVGHWLAAMHTCQQCGTTGPWTKGWRHYPNHQGSRLWELLAGEDVLVCSAECWNLRTGTHQVPTWLNLNEEPLPKEKLRERYQLLNQAWEEQRRAKDYRKYPMPEWKGRGFCKWCNGRMTEADKPSTMWHPGCVEQWKLHCLLDFQFAYLVKRDGRLCADGCGQPGGEVDHRIPLWSVRDLPDEERRPYYGPDNLWLLAPTCHAAKTKREAAERAALRRTGPDQPAML